MIKPKKRQWWHHKDCRQGSGVKITKTCRWYIHVESITFGFLGDKRTYTNIIKREKFLENFFYIEG
jgi:nitrate reductase alpha subunit